MWLLGRVRQILVREIFKKPVRDVREKLKLTVKIERSCFEKYDRIKYIIDERN